MKPIKMREDLKRVLLPFWLNPSNWRGWAWLVLLVGFLLTISYINIRISYAERSVFTALETKDSSVFWQNLITYAIILVASVPVVGSFGWIKMKLEMRWRDWLTRHILGRYLAARNFTKISPSKVDNPDERIQQDVAHYCTESLTISMALLDSTLAFFAFITILYLISPTLLVVAVGYATLGTIVTVVFGKRLVGMLYEQQKLEAEFRYNLVYLRDNAEAIGLYNGGEAEGKGLRSRLSRVMSNLSVIASWQRNLTLFKTSYDYSLLIVPSLVSAPLYFAGEIQLGMMVQAATSFGRVIGALSVVITQFQGFARFSATQSRISDLIGVIDEMERENASENRITTSLADDLALRNVCLSTPDGSRSLVQNLNVELGNNARLIIAGPSGVGKSSVLRAVVGLWASGSGAIERPDLAHVMVLPQESYMPLGNLRDQLTYPKLGSDGKNDASILEALALVNLDDLVERMKEFGGLDAVKTWTEILSPGERQRIAFARLLLASPRLVLLDEATSSLDGDSEKRMYELVTARGIALVSVAHREALIQYHDTVLELQQGGSWRLVSSGKYLEELEEKRKRSRD